MTANTEFHLDAPDLSTWRAGNTGTDGVWSFDSGIPGRHVMISSLVHGNELCGAWAVKSLLELGARPVSGRLTLAFCNLDAFDKFDPANHDASRYVDEDMNRQWSVECLSNPITRERRRAAELAPFVAAADWLLDLHSMHEPGLPLSLAGLSMRNVQLAVQMKSPEHIVVDAGHKDGVRMRDFGHFAPDTASANMAIRSLLVECGFHGDPHSRHVALDQVARFLEQSEVLGPSFQFPSTWRLPDARSQWVLHVTGAVVATSNRFRFVEPYVGLELIPRQGTVIGFDDGVEVRTPHDNCVLVMPSIRQARAGVTVVRFATRLRAEECLRN